MKDASRRTRSLIGLARACHPGPVTAVSAAAVGYGLAIGCTRKEAMRIGLAVLSGQLSIGWQNDWLDAAIDRRSGRQDKPIPNGDVSEILVGSAAVLSGLCCLPASFANGRRSGLTHLAAVFSAAAYNAGLKSTAVSFVPYALSFSLLPVVVHLGREDLSFPPIWAPATAGTLGIAAHLLNVLPDRETDRSMGVLGLPQRLSREQNLAIAGVLLLLSSAFVSFGPRGLDRTSSVRFLTSLGLGAVALSQAIAHHDRRAFRLILVLAMLDVAQLIFFSRRSS